MNNLIIKKLLIKRFRNLENLEFDFSNKINFIYGQNGSGKTAVLDAIRYVLLTKDENGSSFKNKKTISEINELNGLEPNIKILLDYNNNDFLLETRNGDWYFNNIKQSDSKSYLKTLEQHLNNVNIDSLVFYINPNMLQEQLNSSSNTTKDKEKIKAAMISIANSLVDSNESKFSVDEFKELNEKIEDTKRDIKNTKNEIKNIQNKIEYFKSSHTEITNWDISDQNRDYSKDIYLINQKISKFNSIKNEIELLISKQKDKENEINKFDYQINKIKDANNFYAEKESKGNLFVLILLFILGIIPGIIYYFVCYKKKNNNDLNNNDQNVSYHLNAFNKEKQKLIDELNVIKRKIDELYKNDDYQNINLEDLTTQKIKYESLSNSNESDNQNKLKLNDLIVERDKLIHQQNDLENELNNLEYKKRKISEATGKILKDNFSFFDVNLFDEKDKEGLNIKINGIPYEYANQSTKYNVAFNINEFLFNKYKLKTFMLIDNGESFNNFKIKNETQAIITCVSNDKKLRLEQK